MVKQIVLIFMVSVSLNSQASDNMTVFLKSCGYGTLGGAAVGLATLAASENPSGKMSNIARGASLGLYLGIAYGLNQINNPAPVKSELDTSFWLAPQFEMEKLEGASVNWLALRF